MPRYFFNMTSGPYPDADEGIEMKGPDQARSAAITFAAEMLKEVDGRFWGAAEWRLHVTNEQGGTVCRLSLKGTLA